MSARKPKLRAVPTTNADGDNVADILRLALEIDLADAEDKINDLRTTINEALALLKRQGVEPSP
jgi:hypothetical protein